MQNTIWHHLNEFDDMALSVLLAVQGAVAAAKPNLVFVMQGSVPALLVAFVPVSQRATCSGGVCES
jgi:hypothetical protein